jgi:hypothetical protein
MGVMTVQQREHMSQASAVGQARWLLAGALALAAAAAVALSSGVVRADEAAMSPALKAALASAVTVPGARADVVTLE